MSEKWLDWAKELQSIAQAGLTYTKDPYDYERYVELRKLSTEIMNTYTEYDMNMIENLFANETGYQTPKVDIRAAVFQHGELLLVQEKADGKWSLPGGWGDVGYTPAEVAVKEVYEETGYIVKVVRLLAVLDKSKHPHPASPYHTYKIIFQCEIVGGSPSESIETSASGFFNRINLPPLSTGRTTTSQIALLFDYLNDPSKPVIYD
ncbi:NUDIX hydrolase [Guptibacillus algicola]|uniref:NUDIX hydrolase n=1 Tax=Guptibacillus algicola TaxID=225844 RepID=UPI001CD7B0DF|nr:NUDIX hydrolase [Alkalihalobacillus algicola]MCA0988712.1 NUDIX hydrolase [Alkalihalobacillus algicola]